MMRHFKVQANARSLFVMVLAMLGIFAIAPAVSSQGARGTIRGSVLSPDGKPMEGVTVSIRSDSEPFSTTVFTNQKGVYVFPPMLAGKYSLWAQTTGFQTTRVEAVAGKEVAPLQLKVLEDFSKQMTGVEWMNSFPEKTPEDRREKLTYANNCSGCHDNHFALQNRFDVNGWTKIVTVMSKSNEGNQFDLDKVVGLPSMNEYKGEIAAFLAKVRGPQPPNYELKPLPRPTGEETQVVITEYDTPRPEAPAEYLVHDGSDWMEGTPSRWEGRSAHSTTVGGDGRVYFSDDRSMFGTLHELDPKTGIVNDLTFPDNGGVASTHGISTDADGNVWANNGADGDFLEFNVKTQRFKDYPRPDGMRAGVGGTIDADKLAYKDMIWGTSGAASLRLDPKTGQYTYFPNPGSKGTYGITVDRRGNAWYSSPQGDKVYVTDAETGVTSEVGFAPQGPADGVAILDKDKNAYANIKSGPDDTNVMQICPRRMGSDPNADLVWVGLYCSDKIARIDTITHAVTQFAMPYKYSRPYAIMVDRDHNVWVNMLNTDMIAKFDPATQKFVEYRLPTRGTDIRQLGLDYSTGSLVVYAGYSRENKVARLQFRTAADMQ